MQVNRQGLLLRQVARAEDIILPQAEALTAQILIALAVHLTLDHLEQIPVLDPHLLMEEVSLLDTILEIRQVGLLLILPDLALQVEVQVGPQVALTQEDPEVGGINSPFFLENLSENGHNFVTNPT